MDSKHNKIPCKVCSKPLAKSSLHRHMRIHNNQKPYKCDKCSRRFIQKATLVEHQRVHTGEKPFLCNICSKAFAQKSTLESHKRIHVKNRPSYLCNICPKVFTQKKTLERHKRRHDRNKQFQCDICIMGFFTLYNLKIHMYKHIEKTPFKCKQCPKKFRSRSKLYGHMNKHNKTFKCTVCSKSFVDTFLLARHKKTCKGTDLLSIKKSVANKKVSNDKKLLNCKICKEVFENENDLKSHDRKHYKIACKLCSKLLAKSSIHRHMRIHSNEKPYKCDKCSRKFIQKTTLAEHQRVHTGEKPFLCTICSKAFAQKSTLEFHKRTHNKKKPSFLCFICLKVFTHKKSLESHKRKHYRNIQFQCYICKSIYGTLNKLKMHMVKHNGKPTFKCNICFKDFITSMHLMQHFKIHNNNLKCSVCSELFTHPCLLNEHLINCKKIVRILPATRRNKTPSNEPSNLLQIKNNNNNENIENYNVHGGESLKQIEQNDTKLNEEFLKIDPNLYIIYNDAEQNVNTIKKEFDCNNEIDDSPLLCGQHDGELYSVIDIVKDEPIY